MNHARIVIAVFCLVQLSLAEEKVGVPDVQPTCIRNIAVGGRMAEAFAFDPRSKRLVTAGWEYTADENDPDADAWRTSQARGVVQLWDPSNGETLARFQGSVGAIFDVAISPDGKLLATAGRVKNDSDAGEVKIWDMKAHKEKATFGKTPRWVLCAAFSPDGKMLATGGFDKRAKVWEVATGKLMTTLPQHSSDVQDVQFTRNGKSLMTADRKGVVTFWDATNWGKKRGGFRVKGLFLLDARLSRDDKRVAISGQFGEGFLTGGQVRVWDVPSMKEIAVLKTGPLTSSVAFSPDGKWVAAHTFGQTLKVINIATKKDVSIRHGGASSEEMVDFLPDSTLAFTCGPGMVGLWDLKGLTGR